jgi:hypothetical protein
MAKIERKERERSVRVTDLIQSDDEGSLASTEEVEGFNGLGLESTHDVDDENCNVAKRGTTRTKIVEALVTWSIDNQQSRNFDVQLLRLLKEGEKRNTYVCERKRDQ